MIFKLIFLCTFITIASSIDENINTNELSNTNATNVTTTVTPTTTTTITPTTTQINTITTISPDIMYTTTPMPETNNATTCVGPICHAFTKAEQNLLYDFLLAMFIVIMFAFVIFTMVFLWKKCTQKLEVVQSIPTISWSDDENEIDDEEARLIELGGQHFKRNNNI